MDLVQYTSQDGYIGWFEDNSAPPDWREGAYKKITQDDFKSYLYYVDAYFGRAMEQTFQYFNDEYREDGCELEFEDITLSDIDLTDLVLCALENDKEHFTARFNEEYSDWGALLSLVSAFDEYYILPEIDFDKILNKLGHPKLSELETYDVDEYFSVNKLNNNG